MNTILKFTLTFNSALALAVLIIEPATFFKLFSLIVLGLNLFYWKKGEYME